MGNGRFGKWESGVSGSLFSLGEGVVVMVTERVVVVVVMVMTSTVMVVVMVMVKKAVEWSMLRKVCK